MMMMMSVMPMMMMMMMMIMMMMMQMFLYEKEMKWKGGDVPVSEPACGFDGSKCQFKFGMLRSPDLSCIRPSFTSLK